MGDKKTSKTLNFAKIFLIIGLIMLIFNSAFALWAETDMSLGVILFFIIALIWYAKDKKIKNRAKPVNLIVNLGGRGERLLKKNFQNDETCIAKLKGGFGEAFVVTDHNVYVLKWGLMAGQFFGGRCNCWPFERITGIECKKGLVTGIVEVLTPAHQNIKGMSYWAVGSKRSAIESDNAVSFFDRDYNKFQEAVNRARKLMANKSRLSEPGKADNLFQIEKLAELKDKGIITKEEFDAKKKMILGL